MSFSWFRLTNVRKQGLFPLYPTIQSVGQLGDLENGDFMGPGSSVLDAMTPSPSAPRTTNFNSSSLGLAAARTEKIELCSSEFEVWGCGGNKEASSAEKSGPGGAIPQALHCWFDCLGVQGTWRASTWVRI